MTIHPDSILLITLDSCRYDTFARVKPTHLCRVGKLERAMAPSYFTYGSHAAMFMGFLPSIRGEIAYKNSKYAKLFRMANAGFSGKELEGFKLQGPSIVEGFRRNGYRCIGSGAVGWFDPSSETGAVLSQHFDQFYYPGAVWHLGEQLTWIQQQLEDSGDKPVFLFLNIGETHVPYWHQGASWDQSDNPCRPFQRQNRRRDCRSRQMACLQFVDGALEDLLVAFEDASIVVTADHGDCWGEDGLWEHGISHRRTLEVPLLMRVRGQAL